MTAAEHPFAPADESVVVTDVADDLCRADGPISHRRRTARSRDDHVVRESPDQAQCDLERLCARAYGKYGARVGAHPGAEADSKRSFACLGQ